MAKYARLFKTGVGGSAIRDMPVKGDLYVLGQNGRLVDKMPGVGERIAILGEPVIEESTARLVSTSAVLSITEVPVEAGEPSGVFKVKTASGSEYILVVGDE